MRVRERRACGRNGGKEEEEADGGGGWDKKQRECRGVSMNEYVLKRCCRGRWWWCGWRDGVCV